MAYKPRNNEHFVSVNSVKDAALENKEDILFIAAMLIAMLVCLFVSFGVFHQ